MTTPARCKLGDLFELGSKTVALRDDLWCAFDIGLPLKLRVLAELADTADAIASGLRPWAGTSRALSHTHREIRETTSRLVTAVHLVELASEQIVAGLVTHGRRLQPEAEGAHWDRRLAAAASEPLYAAHSLLAQVPAACTDVVETLASVLPPADNATTATAPAERLSALQYAVLREVSSAPSPCPSRPNVPMSSATEICTSPGPRPTPWNPGAWSNAKSNTRVSPAGAFTSPRPVAPACWPGLLPPSTTHRRHHRHGSPQSASAHQAAQPAHPSSVVRPPGDRVCRPRSLRSLNPASATRAADSCCRCRFRRHGAGESSAASLTAERAAPSTARCPTNPCTSRAPFEPASARNVLNPPPTPAF